MTSLQMLLAGGEREARKGGARRRDGPVDVGRAAHRDLGVGLLGRRIDHVEQGRGHRIDPFAVDVELRFVCHRTSPR